MSEKTEEATPRKLSRAANDGDAGLSGQFSQSVAFLVGVSLLGGALFLSASVFSEAIRRSLQSAVELERPLSVMQRLEVFLPIAVIVFVFLLAMGTTGAVLSVVQSGGGFAMKKLAPDLSRLDPFAGMKRLVSWERLFSLFRSLLFSSLVLWLSWLALRTFLPSLVRANADPTRVLSMLVIPSQWLLWRIALLGMVAGLVDLLVQRRAWKKRLRMSKDEVKREHQESDGNPEIKAQRERLHHEMMTQAIVGSVRNATVVVVNPTHIACAVRYEGESEEEEVPTVVASGQGELARRIVAEAHRLGIPVVQDVPLARALHELELGEGIPEDLYEAVAIVLSEIQKHNDGSPD